MKTNNPIIQHRLNQLTDQKTALLKMKKSKRGNQLKVINQTINKLKHWIQESGTMIECSNPVDEILKQRRIDDKQCDGSIKVIVGFINRETGHVRMLDDIQSQTGEHTFDATFKRLSKNQLKGLQMNHLIIDDGIVHHDKKTPEITGKPSTITDKWLEETPEAYQARKMDIVTAFRKMNGFG